MKKTEKMTLIEGSFNEADAREILLNVVLTKIRFHESKNFSSLERFGKECQTAQKRLPDLKQNMKKINELINEAKSTNKSLTIHSEIIITLSDD